MPPRDGAGQADPAPRQRRALLRYQRARETRERLAVEAARLFGERGYDAVTIEQICDEAGVSRSSFYFHFPHKEAVLAELDRVAARRVGEEMAKQAAAGGTIEEALETFVVALARRARRVPRDLLARTMTGAMRGLHLVGQLEDEDADFGRALAEAFARAQAAGEVPAGPDPAELGAVLAAMAMEALLRWAHGTSAAGDLEDALRWRARIFLAGVRAGAGAS